MPDEEKVVPVVELTEVAQAVIRAAPQWSRGRMWNAYQTALKDAQSSSPTRMPWEKPDTVLQLTRPAAIKLIVDVVGVEAGEDVEQRRHYLGIAAAKADSFESPTVTLTRQPGKLGIRNCALVSCCHTFSPDRKNQIYHSENCRKRAYVQRQTQSRS